MGLLVPVGPVQQLAEAVRLPEVERQVPVRRLWKQLPLPVRKGEGFGVSNVMKITLSCDHRSVDGAVGASFLQTFKKYLENPVTMLV